MDIVEKIVDKKVISQSTKIIQLWAVAMVNYRQPLGDKAWAAMKNLTNSDVTNAISYLTGFCLGASPTKLDERIKELLPEDD